MMFFENKTPIKPPDAAPIEYENLSMLFDTDIFFTFHDQIHDIKKPKTKTPT